MNFRIFLLMGVALFLCAATDVHGQTGKDVVSQTPAVADVGYNLPHPGLLPGHMLYSLKETRDNLMGFLISNPLKKAEFNLLQADKHVQASYLLIVGENKDAETAFKSFAKAEEYYEKALKNITDAKGQGLDTSDISKRMALAYLKYKEVMQTIERGVSEKEKGQLKDEKATLEKLGKNVNTIKK